MSKMPAKKKSCFQITSVTTAQAASSITEDTESLDDPDESRTEDVSSEIFDVSRAEEEEEEEVLVERSSSEETLNNVGEADTPGTMSPNVPHDGGGRMGPVPAQQPPPPNAPHDGGAIIRMAPVPATPPQQPPPAACSSRFRVIKLDHSSGEPYRRGRWTCTEYYDKDSDGTLISRTADTIRHTAAAASTTADRDSGLGATGGSVVVVHMAHDSIADSSSLSAVSHVHPSDKINQSQHFVIGAPPQPMMVPYMPPVSSQHQYTQGHMIVTQAGTNTDYMQRTQGTPPLIATPSSLPGQHLPQLMGLHSKSNESVSLAQGGPVHMQQGGGGAAGGVAQVTVPSIKSQQQASGSSILGSHHPGVQNVGGGVSGLSTVPVTMPTAAAAPPATFVQSPLSSHTSVSRSSSLIAAAGLPNASLPPVSPFQTGQIDDRRKSEPLPQPSMPLISEKSFVKVPITDTLANPLHLPVFGLPIPVDGEDDSSSSANVVAIDNKIEQAMDLVKSHLMYAVREEVEVLKEQIKELIEKNSTLERENALLKSLSNSDQLSQLSGQASLSQQQPPVTTAPLTAPQSAHPPQQPNVSSA